MMARFRVFNIGLVVNRTLVYGTLTAIIVGLYIWLVTGLGLLFELETGNLTISLLITVPPCSCATCTRRSTAIATD